MPDSGPKTMNRMSRTNNFDKISKNFRLHSAENRLAAFRLTICFLRASIQQKPYVFCKFLEIVAVTFV